MEYKFEDIKKYLIENGQESEISFGKNKAKVYTVSDYNKPLIKFTYGISGINVLAYRDTISFFSFRYNETRDVIQYHTYHKFSYSLYSEYKWVDLKFDENGRLKCPKGRSELYFDTESEGEEYKGTFMKENWHLAKKYLEADIKESKSRIKKAEKKIEELTRKYGE